jgi:hypothetical protein
MATVNQASLFRLIDFTLSRDGWLGLGSELGMSIFMGERKVHAVTRGLVLMLLSRVEAVLRQVTVQCATTHDRQLDHLMCP